MVWLYIFLVVSLNLGLGYGVAVVFGYGPPRSRERAVVSLPPSTQEITPEPTATADTPASVEAPTPEVPAAELPPKELSPEQPTKPAAQPEPPHSSAPIPIEEQNAVGLAISEFKAELVHYRDQLSELDDRIQQCGDAASAENLEQCASDLKQVNSDYLDKQGDRVEQLDVSDPSLTEVVASVHQTLDEQSEQIEATNSRVDALDLNSDPEQTYQQLRNETVTLVESSNETSQKCGQAEQQLATVIEESAAPPKDSTDESPDGESDIEQALSEWSQENPDRSRQMLLAKIEIDHFEQVAAEFGEATNLMMQAIGDLVSRHVGLGCVRPSETSYVIMFPDRASADVTTSVEQIRQEIEHTQWQSGEDKLRVTASCAVVEALADDTDKMLLERVEATLSEAERYGHNRTYLHEGGQPAPVEPPNLIVTDQTVSLAEAEPHEGLDASHE